VEALAAGLQAVEGLAAAGLQASEESHPYLETGRQEEVEELLVTKAAGFRLGETRSHPSNPIAQEDHQEEHQEGALGLAFQVHPNQAVLGLALILAEGVVSCLQEPGEDTCPAQGPVLEVLEPASRNLQPLDQAPSACGAPHLLLLGG